MGEVRQIERHKPCGNATNRVAPHIFLLGYPGPMGGANTEAWHTVKLWRQADWNVTLIPTWGDGGSFRPNLDAVGAKTVEATKETLKDVPGLAGSPVVAMCNSEALKCLPELRRLGCPFIWVSCMAVVLGERPWFGKHGGADAYIFQSDFQRDQLAPKFAKFGDVNYQRIRGAFDVAEWEFNPRPHKRGEQFIFGRVARPDNDKWSSNTWSIYGRVQYPAKHAIMLGMNEKTHKKLGPAPSWSTCYQPMAIDVKDYYQRLHALAPINGGAFENWPRAGLEAMAAGVPIVAQRQWGWREMIDDGVTGFLGDTDEELAHWLATLAWDEKRRLDMAAAGRERVERLTDPASIIAVWQSVWDHIAGQTTEAKQCA